MKAEDRRAVGFSFARFLGLSLATNSISDVRLSGITIQRVGDVSKLPFRSGQQFILEGIQAQSISISLDHDVGKSLAAAAKAKGYDVSLEAKDSTKNTLNIQGANLYLAIQVAEFSSAIQKETKVRHDGGEITISRRFLFQFCNCIGPGKVRLTVTNVLDLDANGNLTKLAREISDGPGNWSEINLGNTLESGVLSHWSANVRYSRVKNCPATDREGRRVCFSAAYPKEDNWILLRQSSFVIRAVAKPIGLY